MEEKQLYNRDNINFNLSMGEVAFLCGEKILDTSVMSRIITSTILNLNRKKYLEFQEEKKETIIKIKESTEELRESEKLILEYIQNLDNEKDNILKLEEINQKDNKIFSKNKNKIKDCIVAEAKADGYINQSKWKEKEKYLDFLILSIIVFIFMIFICPSIIIETFCIFAIVYIFLLIKYKKIDFYTHKAKKEKENLLALKKYIEQYSILEERNILDIYLWEEYLVYATVFGISKNVLEKINVNLKEQQEETKTDEIRYDFYENKYYIINKLNEKVYVKDKII